jgi:putative transposase
MGGYVYHVLNRAVGRAKLFDHAGDYSAFEKVLRESKSQVPMRLLAFCIMPNHWHLVVWPREDNDLSEWMRWLTVTHTQRWHAAHHTSGTGPLYQGRFKSFPVQDDEHYFILCRYVERNALRANLSQTAEEWRWSSLWHSLHESGQGLLDAGPLPRPTGWVNLVNQPQTDSEVESIRRCVIRGRPFGAETWRQAAVQELGLESTQTPRGRPRKGFGGF